jgi:hypothetical protein
MAAIALVHHHVADADRAQRLSGTPSELGVTLDTEHLATQLGE